MTLDTQLTQMESNASMFESVIRADLPESIAAFQDGGALSFVDSDDQYPLSEAQRSAFSAIVDGDQVSVLEGARSDSKPSGLRVAVLFSGGPAAGGHNVVLGLSEYLGAENTLLGVRRGPKGLLAGDFFEVTAAALKSVRNLGGFNFLMSDRTKIKTEEQFAQVEAVVAQHALNAIVVIGGDDSNTNAAMLAQRLKPLGCNVIGVPKTIDGDLQAGQQVPISFGFDTATKIYAEMVGNICQDTASSVKYWHFVKLMGRSASHVTLEVALQTKPAVALISEEIAAEEMSLEDVVALIADKVRVRAKQGVHHGVVLVPEGVIEFIPEFKVLISELNDVMGQRPDISAMVKGAESMSESSDLMAELRQELGQTSYQLLVSLPKDIAAMLLADRDSHGNLQVSLIQTEQLLSRMVALELSQTDSDIPFKAITHFFGYEGRCGAPTRFDAFYTYNLGQVAAALICDGRSGYMAAVTDFDKGGRALGIPLPGLIVAEKRHGKTELVIEKALVELASPAFKYFASRRAAWAEKDLFSSPGPRQYFGETAKQIPISVALNQGYASLLY